MMDVEIIGQPSIKNNGLGRIPAFDIRDMKHQMKAMLPKKAGITQKYWADSGFWGDQGSASSCVGFAWAHYIENSPISYPDPAKSAKEDPTGIYNQAKEIDEWPGSDYDGTSVRAGAKVLQAKGYIESYSWAWDIQTVVQALLTTGPVVVGTNWYEQMFTPDFRGRIKIGGEAIGGHAYLLNGVNTNTKIIRIKNSWGRAWGNSGHATISFADMERLISEYGEAALAVEKKVA